jgi:predicted  nucleic acid-binding Zn-ribbon protein
MGNTYTINDVLNAQKMRLEKANRELVLAEKKAEYLHGKITTLEITIAELEELQKQTL